MKKRIILFLICCFIISLISGCKNSNPTSYKEETFNDISYKVPADWAIKVDERTTSETFPWIGYQIGENTCLYIKYQKNYPFGNEDVYVNSHISLSDFKTYQETSVASKIFQRFSYSVDNANYYEYALGLSNNTILAVGTIDLSGGTYQGDKEIKQVISSIDLSSISSNEEDLTVSSDTPSKKDPDVSSKDAQTSHSVHTPSGGFDVDWDKCIEDTKRSIMDPEYYWYVKDVHIEIDHSQKRIVLTAVVGDATSADTALDYADTMVRQFNAFAGTQDGSIEGGSKDSYGGLYTQYTALVGVSSLSNVDDEDKWFVNQTLYKGLNQKLELNKAYR